MASQCQSRPYVYNQVGKREVQNIGLPSFRNPAGKANRPRRHLKS